MIHKGKELWGKLWHTLLNLLKFSSSSLLGTFVDLGVLWALTTYIFPEHRLPEGDARVWYLSPAISFEMAALANFCISYFYIWKDRISHISTKSFFRHFLPYNLSTTGVFLVKLAVMNVLSSLFSSWSPVGCNFVALFVTGGLNFAINEWGIFHKRKTPQEQLEEQLEGSLNEEHTANNNCKHTDNAPER